MDRPNGRFFALKNLKRKMGNLQSEETFLQLQGHLDSVQDGVVFLRELLRNLQVRNQDVTPKCCERFEELLQQAKRSLQVGYLDQALEDLNGMLIQIPEQAKQQLRATFALRAQVLLAEGHFRACLKDAERALGFLEPPDLELRASMRTVIDLGQKYLERFAEEEEVEGPKLKARNQEFGCASNALELDDGCFVAARDIKPGEVLLVEEPLVSYVDLSIDPNKHCGHCFKKTLAPLPCPGCHLYVFCDEKCKDASRPLHSRLCLPLSRLTEAAAGDDNSAASAKRVLWLMLIAKAQQFSQFDSDLLQDSSLDALLRLRRPGQGDACSQAVRAAMQPLARALEFHLQLSEEELNCLMVKLVQVVPCVAKATASITQINYEDERPNEPVIRSIGTALCPTLALLTPSCSPNSVVYNSGNKFIVQATRLIQKGAPVTRVLHWRYDFLQVERPQRWSFLKKTPFLGANEACHCEACTHDWPKLSELERRPDDPETQMLIFSKLDGRLLQFGLAKAVEMERQGLLHTVEFWKLQKCIRTRLALQGNVHRCGVEKASCNEMFHIYSSKTRERMALEEKMLPLFRLANRQ